MRPLVPGTLRRGAPRAGPPAARRAAPIERVTETTIDPPSETGMATPARRARCLRADAIRNRALVLAAARTVFQRDGLAAPMDDIAAQAGLGVGTLYRHFPTKEALIAVMVEERQALLLDSARAAAKATDPWEGLQALVWRLATFEAEDRAIADVLVDAQKGPEFGQLATELLTVLSALVTRAQAAGQMRNDVSAQDTLTAVCLIGKLMEAGAEDGSGRWQRLVRVLLDGLRANSPPRT